MVNGKYLFLFLSLFLVLLSAISAPLYSIEQTAVPSGENQESSSITWNRLIEISQQLSILNENLRSELLDSRQNSQSLQSMLETSKRELEELRLELEILRNVSTELSNRASISLSESTELITALKTAEFSLVSLEQSFLNYRTLAEGRISTLERENRFFKWGMIIAGVLAAGFGASMFFVN